jgi:hypothetical protein
MELAREAAVMLRDLRAGAAAARVTEEGEIAPGGKTGRLIEDCELSELDEVIAAAARAELRPRAVLELACSVARTPPIGRPYPTCASGMRAPDTATGSRQAFFSC